MFGIPISTLISLAVKYGPEAVSFIRQVDPLIHQIVVAAAPLAKKVLDSGENVTHEFAATQAVASLAYQASYVDKAKGND